MIDVTAQQLSDAIFAVCKEINRGAWLADRTGGANGGIGVNMPDSVNIKCSVTAHPGSVIVESIQVTESGVKSTTSNETGNQTQRGDTLSSQGGGNTTTSTNKWGEAE